MYKVFINDKLIIFTSTLKSDPSEIYLSIENVNFKDAINKLQNTDLKKIYIKCTDPKKDFHKFLKTFKVVTAGGGLVVNDKDELLFIFRNNRWDIPKGHVDKGESIKEAAIREVEEECGIKNLVIKNSLLTTYHIYSYKEELQIKETYWFLMHTSYNDTLTPQLEEGITKACFIKEINLPKILENTYANIILVYEKYKEVTKK